jgi:hypothetical protein
VICGGFDNRCKSNWALFPGWTIADGVLHGDGTQVGNSAVNEIDPELDPGTYSCTFTISNYVSGRVRIVLGNTGGTWRSGNGTYNENIAYGTSSGYIYIQSESGNNFIGDIDDVSAILN